MRDLQELEFGPGNAADPRVVEAAARELSVRFPESYLALLGVIDGGSPEVGTFRYGDAGESCISEFLRITDVPSYARNVRAQLIPVARDAGDNLICLDLTGPEEPRVVYLDHETNEIFGIAGSFGSFLDGLYS